MDIACLCQTSFSIRGYAVSKRGSTPDVSSIYPPDNELPPMEAPSYWHQCPYCARRLNEAEAFVRDTAPPFVQYQEAADANEEMRLPSPTPHEPDFTVPRDVQAGVLTAVEESPTPPEIRLPSPTPPETRLPSPTPPDIAAPELEQAIDTGGANEAPTEELIKSFSAKKTASRGHKRKRKMKSLADICVSDGQQSPPGRKGVEKTVSKRDKGKAIATDVDNNTDGVVQPRVEGLYIGTTKERMRDRSDNDVALPIGNNKGKQVLPEKANKLMRGIPSPPGSKLYTYQRRHYKKTANRLLDLNKADPLQDKEDNLELDPKNKSSEQETDKDKQLVERNHPDSPTAAHRSSDSGIGFPGIASHWMMRRIPRSALTNTLPSHSPSANSLFPSLLSSLGSGSAQQHRGKTISDIRADEMKKSGPFPSYGNDDNISALQLMSLMDDSSRIPSSQFSPGSAQPRFGNDERPNFLTGSIFSGHHHRQNPMPNSPASFLTLRPQSSALPGHLHPVPNPPSFIQPLRSQATAVSDPPTSLRPHLSAFIQTLRPQSDALSGSIFSSQLHPVTNPPASLRSHSSVAFSSGFVSFRTQENDMSRNILQNVGSRGTGIHPRSDFYIPYLHDPLIRARSLGQIPPADSEMLAGPSRTGTGRHVTSKDPASDSSNKGNK